MRSEVGLVVYINLQGRGDRNRHMIDLLSECPFPFCRSEGIRIINPATDMDANVIAKDSEKRGVLGIFKAHLSALRLAYEYGHQGSTIILEDDLQVDKSIWESDLGLDGMPPDWEILLLGPRLKGRPDSKGLYPDLRSAIERPILIRELLPYYRCTGAHFVIIRDRNTLCRVINCLDSSKIVYDVDSFYINNFHTYGMFNLDIHAGGFPSDHTEEIYDAEPDSILDSVGRIKLFYWDGVPNFGDLISPWLVELISGRQTVNVRRLPGAVGLAAIGSLLTMIDRPLHIWGVGSISPLGRTQHNRIRHFPPIKIHAVRGKLTREACSSIGWNTPSIVGDPALTLPLLYTPDSIHTQSICVCLHFSHTMLFDTTEHNSSISFVNVRHPPRHVVDQIAAAKVCISSSLHGLVVAQAYDIPYVWLHVDREPLSGTNFKFHDFFSTLSGDVSTFSIPPGQKLQASDIIKIAEKATLPRLAISVTELLGAFPQDAL